RRGAAGIVGAGITVLMYNRFRSGSAIRQEEAVRRLVTIAAAASALFAGTMAAEAAKFHRAAHWCEPRYFTSLPQVTCRGLSYCPRGYLTRCDPFRCWCVIT